MLRPSGQSRGWAVVYYATSTKVAASTPVVVRGFLKAPSPYRTMVIESNLPLIEIITVNLLGGEGWPERKADNLTVICELNGIQPCLRNPKCSISSICFPQSCWLIIQGIDRLQFTN
jgi:hypothetical protein